MTQFIICFPLQLQNELLLICNDIAACGYASPLTEEATKISANIVEKVNK